MVELIPDVTVSSPRATADPTWSAASAVTRRGGTARRFALDLASLGWDLCYVESRRMLLAEPRETPAGEPVHTGESTCLPPGSRGTRLAGGSFRHTH